MNIIDSLLVALGFEIETQDLDQLKEKVGEAKETMLSIGAAATAAAGAIGLFVAEIASGLDDLGDWAEMEQVAVEAVQELGYAAQLNGSSFEAVKSSISNLNRVMGEAVLGIGRGAMTFEKLGLSAKDAQGNVKSVDEMMSEIADRMQGMSRQEAIAFAEKLGIDRSMIPLLMKGREELEKYREEARAFGVATEEQVQIASDFQDSVDRTKFMLSGLVRTIAVQLMPTVREVIDGFRDWIMQNREVIKSSIGTALKILSTIIGRLWDLLRGFVGAMIDAVKWILQFKVAAYAAGLALAFMASVQVGKALGSLLVLIKGLSAAMQTFNLRAMLAAGLIGAVALAIALVVDDFLAWKEGGDSVLGELIAQFPELLGVINAVEEGARQVFGFLGELWNIVGPPIGELGAALWSLITTLTTILWPAAKVVLQGFAYLLQALLPVIASLVAWVAEAVAGIAAWLTNMVTAFVNGVTGLVNAVYSVVQWIVNGITGAIQTVLGWVDKAVNAAKKVGEFLGLGDSKVTATMTQAPAQGGRPGLFGGAPGVLGKAADQTNNTTVSQQTVTVTAPITINSPDPNKAGQSVREELNRVNKQATRNGQSAVAL